MKKYILLILFFIELVIQKSIAQSALNSAGKTLKDSSTSYAYSIGEVGGFTIQSYCMFTQGVIQPARFLCIPVNYEYNDIYEIAYYPNPVVSIVIIETDYPDFSTYKLFASDGRLVQSGKYTYSPINLVTLPKGFYLLQLLSSDYKTKKTLKIIKQ